MLPRPSAATLVALTLATVQLSACSDPPSSTPVPIGDAPAPPAAGGEQDGPPPGSGDGSRPPGTDGAGPPPGAPDPTAGARTETPVSTPFPAAALLAAAAPVTDAAAPLQPGSWVDGVEPTVLANTCELEEIDALGDLLDAGRVRVELAPGAAAGQFTLVPRPDDDDEEDDPADAEEEEDGLDFGFGLPAAISCSIAADSGAVDCASLDAEAPVEGGGAIALRHQFLVSIPDPRLLQVEIWSQVRCVDCAQPPSKVSLPCATKLRRALVFEGTEGNLGPVKEGRASGVALPTPSTPTTTQP